MTYKKIIEKELTKQQWEIIEIGRLGEWWEEEHWKIQWKHKRGLVLFLQFLVDPQDDTTVWGIRASKDLIYKRVNNSDISSLSMSRGKFNIKLDRFIKEVEAYRMNLTDEKAD